MNSSNAHYIADLSLMFRKDAMRRQGEAETQHREAFNHQQAVIAFLEESKVLGTVKATFNASDSIELDIHVEGAPYGWWELCDQKTKEKIGVLHVSACSMSIRCTNPKKFPELCRRFGITEIGACPHIAASIARAKKTQSEYTSLKRALARNT